MACFTNCALMKFAERFLLLPHWEPGAVVRYFKPAAEFCDIYAVKCAHISNLTFGGCGCLTSAPVQRTAV